MFRVCVMQIIDRADMLPQALFHFVTERASVCDRPKQIQLIHAGLKNNMRTKLVLVLVYR